MSDDPTLHPAIRDAQAAFEDHLDGCPQCQQASSAQSACPQGQRLHEAAVLAAHQVREESTDGGR